MGKRSVVILVLAVFVSFSLFLIGSQQNLAVAQDSSQASTSFSCSMVSEIPEPECNALVDFYNSTTGASWKNHTDWLVSFTPCSWYGVTCDTGHVTMLIMEDNNLVGTLPTSIGNLSYLNFFDVAMNSLYGTIPVEIGNLSNLSTLAFLYNDFTGSIPPELGSLTNLQSLLLDSNSLSGSIPPQLGGLTNLKRLNLGWNQLTGAIPAELWGLTKLEDLELGQNQLSGAISADIENLVNLTQLYLHGNSGLNGSLPQNLTALTKLGTFWFNSTNLCAPRDEVFQTWLSAIPNKTVTWNCLAAPVKTAPAANKYLNDTTPKFTWQSQMVGEKYQILVDNDIDFSSPTLKATGLLNPYKSFATALAQGAYYWKVRAQDPGGTWSPWSTKWKFTVDTTKPGKPTLLTPLNGSKTSDRTPTFTWKAVVGAKYYQLVVDDNADFSSPVFTSAWMTATSKTLGTSLAPKLYYWRVRAKDAAGNIGLWSAVWKVTIK